MNTLRMIALLLVLPFTMSLALMAQAQTGALDIQAAEESLILNSLSASAQFS